MVELVDLNMTLCNWRRWAGSVKWHKWRKQWPGRRTVERLDLDYCSRYLHGSYICLGMRWPSTVQLACLHSQHLACQLSSWNHYIIRYVKDTFHKTFLDLTNRRSAIYRYLSNNSINSVLRSTILSCKVVLSGVCWCRSRLEPEQCWNNVLLSPPRYASQKVESKR